MGNKQTNRNLTKNSHIKTGKIDNDRKRMKIHKKDQIIPQQVVWKKNYNNKTTFF